MCYDCGRSWPTRALRCPSCQGLRRTQGITRPRLAERPPSAELPWPLSVLHAWPPGGVVSLTGDKGSGKSTLAALLTTRYPDTTWITSEQSDQEVGAAFSRLRIEAPYVASLKTADGIHELLTTLSGGLLVLDSLSAIPGWDTQVQLARAIDAWAEAPSELDRRALIILQHNAQGVAVGANSIGHLVDATPDITILGGLRVIATAKNRFGDLGSLYFKLGERGVERPVFKGAAYSVEGEGGNYRLAAYKGQTTEYNGLLRAWERKNATNVPGIASYTTPMRGYPDGVYRPEDAEQRRKFAEAHGLVVCETFDEIAQNLPAEVSNGG